MVAFVMVSLVVIVAVLVGYMIYVSSEPARVEPIGPPPTTEELLQARLEIARVEKGVDLALAKQEVRMASARTKEAIAEALGDER